MVGGAGSQANGQAIDISVTDEVVQGGASFQTWSEANVHSTTGSRFEWRYQVKLIYCPTTGSDKSG
jgi:hypothetical protein